ncbi:MAG: beta-N-acetylhexosaminidase [Hyphomicrobium sp.]
MNRRALIVGLSGAEITDDEVAYLKDVRPMGLILFKRNCVGREQIIKLLSDARSAIGGDETLTLIDQEGGRVQRLLPPLGRRLPPAAAYGQLYKSGQKKRACEAAFSVSRLLAQDLRELGINTNCAPVLDLPVPGAHDIIGDRAYSTSVDEIVALGRSVALGFMAGGVLPVIKHIPGHGRANKDSHLDLPVVHTSRDELSRTDFATFAALSDIPAAMTAHVVFSSIDAKAPASTSKKIIQDVVRGEIGYDGLLMSDDLGMHALTGSMKDRAEAVIKAGCDIVLHCSGTMSEMKDAALGSPELSGKPLERANQAFAVTEKKVHFNISEAEEYLSQVIAAYSKSSESV